MSFRSNPSEKNREKASSSASDISFASSLRDPNANYNASNNENDCKHSEGNTTDILLSNFWPYLHNSHVTYDITDDFALLIVQAEDDVSLSMDADCNDAGSLMANCDYSMQQPQQQQGMFNQNPSKRIQNQPPESSPGKSNFQDDLSSVSKRLNEMNVKDRENALYEVHGLPMDDEYYDQELDVKENNIEKNPEQLNALLQELDRLVEERLGANKNGEIDLEYHRAIIATIEEQERQDKLFEEAATAQAALANHGQAAASFTIPDPSESQQVDQSLMSQTASSKTDMTFAEFEQHSSVDSILDTASLVGFIKSTSSNSNPNSNLACAKIQSVKKVYETTVVNETTAVTTPSPNDIVMGRGPWNKHHTGNLRLKAMLERDRHRYESSSRFERMEIVDGMLNELYENYGSRFLYKDTNALKKGQSDDGKLTSRSRKSRSNSHTDEWPSSGGPWMIAPRERAHNKITHDFRNLRRQKPKEMDGNSGDWREV